MNELANAPLNSTLLADRKILAILQQGLDRMRQHNNLVSVRSLALRLGMSPSYLSKLFRGERRLPLRKVAPIAKALRLDHHETAQIQRLLLTELETRDVATATGIRTLDGDQLGARVTESYQALGSHDLWLLNEWYHLPILNLVTVDGFVAQADWIAKRLGITTGRAAQSVSLLLENGFLIRDDAGNLKRTQLRVRFPTQRSHPSLRAYHRAMIEKAAKELGHAPTDKEFSDRLISGMAFAGDPRRLTEAKLMIEEALIKAAEHLAGGDCSEVFQMNLQLFKLTNQ